jgi:hypothetical protein
MLSGLVVGSNPTHPTIFHPDVLGINPRRSIATGGKKLDFVRIRRAGQEFQTGVPTGIRF